MQLERAAGGAALVAIAPVLAPAPFTLSDHPVFVEAARLVLAGRSPYDAAAWSEIAARIGSPYIADLVRTTGVWPHPPWVAYAFVPFALLPGTLGYWALHLALLAAGVAGALLLLKDVRWADPRARALAVAVALTSQPLVIGIRWGQLGPLLLLGLALLVRGIARRRARDLVPAALLLALKPHVVVLLALAGAWLALRRAPRAAAGAAIALALACLPPLALAGGPWLAAAGTGYAARIDALAAYATTYALAIDLAPPAWPAVAALLLAIALAAGAFTLRRRGTADPRWPLAVAALGSLAAAPYLWPTDQAIALLPVLLVLGAPVALRGAHALLAVVSLSALPWLLFLASAPRPTQAWTALVPLVTLVLLARSAGLSGAPAARPASPGAVTRAAR